MAKLQIRANIAINHGLTESLRQPSVKRPEVTIPYATYILHLFVKPLKYSTIITRNFKSYNGGLEYVS